MNSGNPLPSEDYEASSVSHTLRLKWKVPRHLFYDGEHIPRPVPELFDPPQAYSLLKVMQTSKVMKFNNLIVHPFVLVLLRHAYNWTFHLALASASKDGVKLDYAFASHDEHLFYLGLLDRSPPVYIRDLELTSSRVRDLKRDRITIVCGVSASSDVSPTESNPEELIYECSLKRDEDESSPVEDTAFWSTSTSSTGAEALDRYSLSGALPRLDVALAKELLVLAGARGCPELKALSVEYLVGHLDPGNVVGILQVACEHREERLMSKCYEFMSEKCRVVHK